MVLLALLMGCAALVVSCQGKDKGEATITKADIPDQEISEYKTVESDSGVVRWILKAPVARIYNAKKLLVTDSPRIEFYDEMGMLTSVLISEKGEYNQVTHDLTALGSVVVTSQEGYVLESESLVWVEKLGEIHSEDFVKFTKGNDVITGYGLRGDPGLRDIEIQRNVKAFLRDDEGMLKEEIANDAAPGGKQGE